MTSNPGPGGGSAGSAAPGPGPAPPDPATPGGAPPRPRPPVPDSRRLIAVIIGLVGLVGLVGLPVGWFLLVVVLWGLGGGDAPQPGTAGPAPLTGQFVFGPGGNQVAFIDASAPDLTRVKVTDAITRKTVITVTDPHVVDAAAFSLDGKTLATLDADGRVYLRNAATGQPTGTLTDASSTGPDGKRRQLVATWTIPGGAGILTVGRLPGTFGSG
jgi:hypothetical protein